MTGPLHGASKLYTDLRFVYDQWTCDPFEELFKQLIEMPNPPFEIDHAFLELHYPGECLVDDQAVHLRPKRHLVKESLLTRLFIQLDHLLLDSSGDDHFRRVLHGTKATQVTRIVGHIKRVFGSLVGHDFSPCSVCGASSVGELPGGGSGSAATGGEAS